MFSDRRNSIYQGHFGWLKENLFLEDSLHWSILHYILLVTKNYYPLGVQSMFRYNLELIGNLESLFRVHMLPWQMNKILIFLIFPVFSGFSSLFTFLHFSLFLAYFGISLHIFVINFGKNFGKFQVCTKGKSAIGNRQVRNWGLRYILAFSHFSLIFIRSL